MTELTPELQVKRCLEKGEKLIWAGCPDPDAFQKGLVRPYFITTHNAFLDNRLFRRLVKTILVIAFLVFFVVPIFTRDGGFVVATPFGDESTVLWILALPVIFYAFRYLNIFRRNDWKGRGYAHAKGLSYGITNKRLLILRDGVIEEEFTVAEVSPKLNERLNAPGFGDIIWRKRRLRHRHNDTRPSPYEIELARIGFKALPDAESVMQKIAAWRKGQVEEKAQEGEAFLKNSERSAEDPGNSSAVDPEVESRREPEKEADTKYSESATIDQKVGRSIHNSTLGFSIEFPEQWEAKVRKRRLAFGKWGIEKEAVWSDEDEMTQWNVVKVESELGSKVEVQVHKTKPINTFEKLVGANTGISGLLELVEKNPDFRVNGLKGFYVTRSSAGGGSLISKMAYAGETYTRLHVFHDGEKQYYVESNWRKDAPAEGKLCEKIVSSLKTG